MRGRLTASVVIAAGALALVQGGPAAFAHGETTPTLMTLVDKVAPKVPGLQVDVLRDQVARLQVINHTGKDLAILAKSGDPFLRIGPNGVYANVNSITWYVSGNPDGRANPPASARLGGPPRWVRVSRERRWAWFDHRMHPGKTPVGQESVDGRRRARLDDWTVPARLGGQKLVIDGHTEYRPLRGGIITRLAGSGAVSPGVSVQLLNGALPGLYLTNASGRPVTVLGKEGEPFARIGPRGVEINELSPTHREDAVAKREAPTLGRSDAAAPPRWKRVSSSQTYAWLDTRARYLLQQPPEKIVMGTRKVVLTRWRVPVRTLRGQVAIRGTTSWVPLPEVVATRGKDIDRSGLYELAGALLALLALVGGAVALRVRAAHGASMERPLEKV